MKVENEFLNEIIRVLVCLLTDVQFQCDHTWLYNTRDSYRPNVICSVEMWTNVRVLIAASKLRLSVAEQRCLDIHGVTLHSQFHGRCLEELNCDKNHATPEDVV
jgi:hypothetical protein